MAREPLGLAHATPYEKLYFSWVNPLIDKGFHDIFDEQEARFLLPPEDDAPALAHQFENCYADVKVREGGRWAATSDRRPVGSEALGSGRRQRQCCSARADRLHLNCLPRAPASLAHTPPLHCCACRRAAAAGPRASA